MRQRTQIINPLRAHPAELGLVAAQGNTGVNELRAIVTDEQDTRLPIDARAMDTVRSIVAGAALLTLPAEAQDHRFETDPIVMVRENFVVCDVLSQLQRVMDNPRFLLAGECEPLPAGNRVRIYASRGPYVCVYPEDTITPCKWTHEKVLSK